MSDRGRAGLRERIMGGARIGADEARALFDWPLAELGAVAGACRAMRAPGDTVGFILDRIINYSNVCEAGCGFCAFHAKAGTIEPYDLTPDEILEKIAELSALGGTQVMLQGGLHPDRGLDFYTGLVRTVKQAFPSVYLHSFSPAELVHISRRERITVDQTVKALKAAGLDSVPGASDLLVDRVRRIVSPRKISKDEWAGVMDVLRDNGMKSSATMTYGLGESLEERVEHLAVVRDVQDRTGILRAFIPWSFSACNTEFPDIPPSTGVEYLRMVAVARIFLDNVDHIQAGWLTEGMELAQIALAFGADDMGGILMEESVVKATGVTMTTNRDELVSVIKNAGRVPVQRDSDYEILRCY